MRAISQRLSPSALSQLAAVSRPRSEEEGKGTCGLREAKEEEAVLKPGGEDRHVSVVFVAVLFVLVQVSRSVGV